jgi:hypothetical protein
MENMKEMEKLMAPQMEMLKGALEHAEKTGEDPNDLIRTCVTGQLMSASQEARKAGLNDLADALICLPAAFWRVLEVEPLPGTTPNNITPLRQGA